MKKILAIVIATLAIIVVIGFVFFNKKQKTSQPPSPLPNAQGVAEQVVKDKALKNALNVYARAKQQGLDLSSGPCLGIIAPDWVLDIAHSPRQSVDDKPENQCADFREGRTHHFIELDPDGKLIKAL